MGEIMKVYGETVFDIGYLLIAFIIGLCMLAKREDKLDKLMGIATLILGCGDAFHLVPRILNYFVDGDFSAALGIGKLVTSVTMTIFYIFMFYIYRNNYKVNNTQKLECTIWTLAIIRIILCLLPQNNWMTNNGSVTIGIIRNIPFLLMGLVIIILYFRERKNDKVFQTMWLYVLLSFLFYIPVVAGASAAPALGMLMLPKTVCYILIIKSFYRKVKNEDIMSKK